MINVYSKSLLQGCHIALIHGHLPGPSQSRIETLRTPERALTLPYCTHFHSLHRTSTLTSTPHHRSFQIFPFATAQSGVFDEKGTAWSSYHPRVIRRHLVEFPFEEALWFSVNNVPASWMDQDVRLPPALHDL